MSRKIMLIFGRMFENFLIMPKTTLMLIKTRKAYEMELKDLIIALIFLGMMLALIGWKLFKPESAAQTASSCITEPMGGPFA